jgi:sulfite exporter TauE/SafE
MIYWLLLFLGGILGSSHCVGMCGGFVLTLGHGESRVGVNLRRQLLYALGRICTYTLAGAVVGYGGWRLDRELAPLVNAQALLLILAGIFVLVQGLFTAGVFRKLWVSQKGKTCPGAGPFASLLRSRGTGVVFVAGMLNGLIPCGLVYSYLLLAVSSGNLFLGMATMAVFGLGTLPVLVLTGCGASFLSLPSRRRLFQVAAWALVLVGGLTIYRGADLLIQPAEAPSAHCPLCD